MHGKGANAAKAVDLMRDRFQVRRVHARMVPAEMIKFQVIGNRPREDHETEAVGLHEPPAGRETSVTFGLRRCPHPARAKVGAARRDRAVLVYLCPEPI